MKKLKQIFLFSMLFLSSFAFAQRTVSGSVTDEATKEPLIGASVTVKGTTDGTITDADGKYQLKLNTNGGVTLVVTFVGYTSKEVALDANQTSLDIALGTGLELDNIVVIGSRNATRTKMETPVAVDVIPLSQVVNEVGQVDVNQILNYVAPSFQSARQAISDGTDHVDPAQLRGLGPDQVLVLVNGKRRHQSSLVNVNGTVNRGTVGTDLNAIPATAVERIEILRDGAAAQYGSDAIAGVINIVLKKSTGLSATVSAGTHITSYDKNLAWNKLNPTRQLPTSVNANDGQTIQAGVGYGLKIGDKGHLNLMGEFTRRGETNRTGLYTGAVYPNVGANNRDDSIMTARGLTRDNFDMLIGNSRMQGAGVMYNFAMPINENFEVYSFGGYNNKKGFAAGFYRYPSGVPAGIRNNVFTQYPNGFLPEINSDVTDMSLAVGVRGKLADWNVDLSQVYGSNTFDFSITNSVNYTQAVSTSAFQKEFDAGGTAFNQLTTNLDLSRNYKDILNGLNVAFGAEYRRDGYSVRAGEEASWRNYNTASGVAAGAQVFAGFLPSNAVSNVGRSNIALYADGELDITKNLMFGTALRFENYSDFGSTLNFKAVGRYKITDGISLRGSVSSGFRAPSQQQKYYSKTNTVFQNIGGNLVPVEQGTFTNNSAAAKAVGIPELKQETSLHYALGLTARLAEGLDFTLDAYQVNINNRIILTNNFSASAFTDTVVRNQLRAAGAEVANFFTNAVDTRARGLEAVLTYNKRFDEHDFRIAFAATFIQNKVLDSADVDNNGIAKPYIKASPTLINNRLQANYFNREDESRMEIAVPIDKQTLTINYKFRKFGAMLRLVRFGEVSYSDPNVTSTNPADSLTNAAGWPLNAFTGKREILDQVFSAKLVTDLTLNYQVIPGLNVSLGANNLFDVYQDAHTHANNVSLGRFVYSRRVQQMGFNGRYVFMRLNYTLK